ncbi:MAG: beta-N-acetylhexosaminidase [Spirochaetaceae bacterium]|jgi:hexosaminidase|nr:beta-N-acetylhexosaminidase [Spirochaetaceae bacterium]
MQIDLIPRPVYLEYQEGFFQNAGLPGIGGDRVFQGEMALAAEQFRRDLGLPPGEAPGKAAVACREVPPLREGEQGKEAYRLTITAGGITLEASAGAGIYHGLQTLRQLILSGYDHNTLTIPALTISDYPRFPWRGFMLDVSRHFYTPSFIKKLLDVLSLHHINVFHWHLTDDQGWRFPVPAYPELIETGSKRRDLRNPQTPELKQFYTSGEIRELVAYAGARHITVVPEVDLPGHTKAALAAYPELGCTGGPYQVDDQHGIFSDVLCAGNDRIFDLVEAVFDTLAEFFPAPYVHIGGDEVPVSRWEACPKCRRRLEELGFERPRQLQGWLTARFARMLKERLKIPLGWDEVLEDTEKMGLPPELVVMSWRGREGGVKASSAGHPVVMSPSNDGCYLDYRNYDLPEEPGAGSRITRVYDTYMTDPVTPEMTRDQAALVLGGQGNLWSELIYAGRWAEYMIFPRMCALAESLWSPRELKDFASFSRRLPAHQKRLDMLNILSYRGPLQ